MTTTIYQTYTVQCIRIDYGNNILCKLNQRIEKDKTIIESFNFYINTQTQLFKLYYIPNISQVYFPSEYYSFSNTNHFKNWTLTEFENFNEFSFLYSIQDYVIRDYKHQCVLTPLIINDIDCMHKLGLQGNISDITSMLKKHNIPILPLDRNFTSHINTKEPISASLISIPYYNRIYEEADYTIHITIKPSDKELYSLKEEFDILKLLYPEFVEDCLLWKYSIKRNPSYTLVDD